MNRNIEDKVALLIKSEKTLLRLEMRKKVRQGFLIIVTLILLLCALAALNVASFIYLSSFVTPLVSALSLAVVDFFLAAILLIIAFNIGLGEDEKSAYEIRDFARTQIRHEIEDVRSSFFSFKNAISLLSLFKKGRN